MYIRTGALQLLDGKSCFGNIRVANTLHSPSGARLRQSVLAADSHTSVAEFGFSAFQIKQSKALPFGGANGQPSFDYLMCHAIDSDGLETEVRRSVQIHYSRDSHEKRQPYLLLRTTERKN